VPHGSAGGWKYSLAPEIRSQMTIIRAALQKRAERTASRGPRDPGFAFRSGPNGGNIHVDPARAREYAACCAAGPTPPAVPSFAQTPRSRMSRPRSSERVQPWAIASTTSLAYQHAAKISRHRSTTRTFPARLFAGAASARQRFTRMTLGNREIAAIAAASASEPRLFKDRLARCRSSRLARDGAAEPAATLRARW